MSGAEGAVGVGGAVGVDGAVGGPRSVEDGALVLLAHGSPDPRHAAGIEAITARVRRLVAPRPVHTAYLDHHPPSVTDVASVSNGGVLVPLLLTRATHVRNDVPVAAATMSGLGRGSYAVAAALGPDELLFVACDELLAAGGVAPDEGTAVVLYAGGSSDREAVSAIGAAAADARSGRGWGPWTVAALAGGDPLDVVVAGLHTDPDVHDVVVVSYMVADGVLRDRMVERAHAEGVRVVDGTLGDTEAVARLLVRRADEARAGLRPSEA